MSQAALVTRLAVRELWITFRLLVVLVVFVGPGAVVALLPAAPSVTLERLATGMGVATVVVSGLAAWSLADERSAGRTGWLITRAVPRGMYLLGWFLAFGLISLVGIVSAAVLAWMTVAPVVRELDLAEMATGFVAVAGAVAAALALGLLIGSFAHALPAAVAAIAACLLVGVGALLLPGHEALHPYVVLAGTALPGSVVSDALRSGGIGLTAAALLLAFSRLAIERAEL